MVLIYIVIIYFMYVPLKHLILIPDLVITTLDPLKTSLLVMITLKNF